MFGFGTTNSLTMDKPRPESLLDTSVQGVISRPLDRIDGPAKVSGAVPYAAEYAFENMAYGVLVGSKIAAGRIVAVDADAVRSIPGVINVVTDFDRFIRVAGQGGDTKAPTQGVRDITFFGEIVAIVVAESFEVARDAAQRLPVTYEASEGQYDFAAHRSETRKPADDATKAHFAQGDVDGAMAKAHATIDVTYVTPSQNSAAMEPHASTAVWEEDGSLSLYGAYQMPTSDAQQLAKSLGIPANKVRIIARYIGGGFGSKLGIAPESVAAAIAAKQIGRPVKAVMARQQVFDATVRRSNTEQRIRLAATADGVLTAIGHETLCSNQSTEGYFEPAGIGTHMLYAGENRLITHDLVDLNFVLSGSMRAPGEAVGMMALEGAMDELAEKLNMDPIALRKLNDPTVDPEKDVPYSSRKLTQALDEGATVFGWDQRQAVGARRDGEWLIGMGVASAVRGNMLQESSAKVEIHPDGSATVSSAMTDIGTGSYTILAQIASEILGIPVDNITMSLGDTNDPPAAGSGGSWGAGSAGSAVYLACEMLRGKLAKAMDVDDDSLTLKDGFAIGDNRSKPIGDLVGKGLEATGHIKPGKQEKATTQASYGAHFAEVGVNVVTGEVRVRRMLGVFAAGRVLNAKTARSQCLGGMTFGIGTALTEDLVHDTRTGKLVNRDLGEYHVPANADVPQIDVHFLNERDIHANPIHAKGIGELGISGAGAAIANAVYNACGVRVRDFPITCDKLLAGVAAGLIADTGKDRMAENDSVLAAARSWKGEPMAIATVVSTWGSAPRPRGSHMLVHADGRFEGSVSGGCVESDILATAAEVIAGASFQVKTYGVADAAAWEVGLPCGGEIAVMIQPVSGEGFDPDLFDRIADARNGGAALTVTTDLVTGHSDAEPGETGTLFVNRYDPPRRLLIVGAVQIAQALVQLVAALGIEAVVIDPRARFLTPERFPGVTLDDRWPDEAIGAWRPSSSTAVVTLSHDTKIDDPALIAALASDAAYVGALGSRKSHAARRDRLAAAGVTPDRIDRIDAPVGIDIGAIGPSEIALSIAAAMVGAFHDRR